MKTIRNTLISLLCFVFLLSACSFESEDAGSSSEAVSSVPEISDVFGEVSGAEESSMPEHESVDESSETSIDESSVPEPEIEVPKYDDLFGMMEDCGRDIMPYGDLDSTEYIESIAKLDAVLDGCERNISVVAYSLDNSKAFCYNTSARIFCASAIKAPYALYACLQMESGFCDLDTEKVYESGHYETGTGDLQYQPLGSVFDMRTIISKTMSISDNVGYLMMVDHFGRDGYNEWVNALGAPSLEIKPTVWSLRTNAKDLALVWREIAKYFESETAISNFLYDSCTNTPNNFATQSLSGVDYSHKQGNNRSGDWHSYSDAGIVWKGEENDAYILVILTDAPGPSEYDAAVMADIIDIVHNELF